MAEFCRECFISCLKPTQREIDHIVMSQDDDFCEGCGQIKTVVLYIDDNEDKK